jgi:hypothetical protein
MLAPEDRFVPGEGFKPRALGTPGFGFFVPAAPGPAPIASPAAPPPAPPPPAPLPPPPAPPPWAKADAAALAISSVAVNTITVFLFVTYSDEPDALLRPIGAFALESRRPTLKSVTRRQFSPKDVRQDIRSARAHGGADLPASPRIKVIDETRHSPTARSHGDAESPCFAEFRTKRRGAMSAQVNAAQRQAMPSTKPYLDIEHQWIMLAIRPRQNLTRPQSGATRALMS